jgi:hypothetical protein
MEVRPQKEPDLQKGPGTQKEALTNVKVAIFKENYLGDKLMEDEQDLILKVLGRVFHGTLKELKHLKSFRLVHSCMCVLSNSLVNDSSRKLTITGWDQGPG